MNNLIMCLLFANFIAFDDNMLLCFLCEIITFNSRNWVKDVPFTYLGNISLPTYPLLYCYFQAINSPLM